MNPRNNFNNSHAELDIKRFKEDPSQLQSNKLPPRNAKLQAKNRLGNNQTNTDDEQQSINGSKKEGNERKKKVLKRRTKIDDNIGTKSSGSKSMTKKFDS